MKKNKTRKRVVAVLAILCAIIIIIVGTFGFQTMSQQGWGQSVARDRFPSGRLHIDQEVLGILPGNNFGEKEWTPGRSADKAVYAENFGEGESIFVRVRLSEYMETGSGAQLHPGDPNFASREATPLIPGSNRLDPMTWTTLLPDAETDSASAQFRDYWTLLKGGGKWFMPTFNKDVISREPDVKGDAWALVPNLPELPNSTRRGGLPHAVIDDRPYIQDSPHAYLPEAGGREYFELNPEWSATVKTYDWDMGLNVMATAPVTHTAKETLDAEIMTMAEWIADECPIDNIWVLDTDGWAYWASPLKPGEATGLLISETKYISPAAGTLYYAIYADAEFTVGYMWQLSFTRLTDEAQELMNIITNL